MHHGQIDGRVELRHHFAGFHRRVEIRIELEMLPEIWLPTVTLTTG